MMRKIIPALTLAAVAAAALVTPALAELDTVNPNYGNYYAPTAGVAGAAAGTAVGVGLYNGWLGSSAAVAAAPTTAVGAAAAGGVVGVGTVALVDAAIEPCRGFQAMFLMHRDQCANGQPVTEAPLRRRTVVR
jgi:hypothetical protein